MSPAPSHNPNARGVPPDPGGRSRYLLLGIAITCILLGIIAVFLMFRLHSAQPPPTPGQQPGSSGKGSGSALSQPQMSPFGEAQNPRLAGAGLRG